MPACGEASVPQAKDEGEKQGAYEGEIGQKADGNDRSACKVPTGEGASYPLFFLQGGNACARPIVRSGSVDEVAEGGHAKQGARREGKKECQVLGGKLENCIPQKERIEKRKEIGGELIKKEHPLFQAGLGVEPFRISVVDSRIVVFHGYSIARADRKVKRPEEVPRGVAVYSVVLVQV